MSARTLPTMPTWTAGEGITSTLLNQITTWNLFWANPPMVKMVQSVVQSVANGTFTQITLDTGIWDTDSGRSVSTPYSYVIPFAGRWEWHLGSSWTFNATGSRISVLYQNGAAAGDSQDIDPSNGLTADMAGRTITINCNVGDTIGLYGYQNSGGALNTDVGGTGPSYLEGRLISLANP